MTEVVYFPAKTVIEEELQFLTSVLSAKAGEFSYDVRELPRWDLTYSYSTIQTSLDFKALAEKIGSKLCKMPIWFTYGVVTDLSAGSSSITLSLNYLWFPVDTKEVLIFSALNAWELRSVASFTGNVLTLAEPLIQDYAKVYIIPVVEGRILEGIKFHEGLSADLNFQTDYFNPVSETFPTFKGKLVCPFKFEKTSVEHRIVRKTEVFDSLTGITEPLDIESYDRLPFSGNLIALGRNQINSLRNFLTTLGGRKSHFYLSMGLPEFKPITQNLTAGATYVDVKRTLRVSKPRILALKSFTELLYIESSSLEHISASTTRVYFSSPLTSNFSNLKGIEFLNLVRLDTDSVKISHKSKQLALAGITVITTQGLSLESISPVADWVLVHALEFTNSDFSNSAIVDPNNYWTITQWAGSPTYISNGTGGLALTNCTFYASLTLELTKFAAVEFSILTTVYDSLLVEGTSAEEYIYITAEGFLKIGTTVTTEVLKLNTYCTFLFKQVGYNSVEVYLKKSGTYILLLASSNEFLVRGNLEFNSPWGRDVLSERVDFVRLYVKNI